MNDLRGMELKGGSSNANDVPLSNGIVATSVNKPRCKPGPKKKASPRSEKESCRLTVEEKAERRKYCQKYGIKPADLLRAAYLAATINESDKGKIIYDASIMLRELEISTGKMKKRLADEGDAVTASWLAAINTGITAVLKRMVMLVPIAISTAYFLSLLNTDVVAGYGNMVGNRYQLAWLLGCITGALFDVLIYVLLKRYRYQIGWFVAKSLFLIYHKMQKRKHIRKRGH